MGNRIIVKGAREHNLKNVDVKMPRDSLVVITGVSGSGKSSLAFDTIYQEGRRRYLSTMSSYARHFLGKLGRASADSIEGLSPSISVDQKTVVRSPRSTVGTMSQINDHLRLLLARMGDGPSGTTSSMFSFNSNKGACPTCKGLGVTDKIDPAKLISDNTKTIRQGALVITTPTGYLIYSQVTMEVLDQVCNANGFNVDIPWRDLTDKQLDVVLNGSDKIKIPFGKHPLESRMKWKGITAKPREEGLYKGILPVMEQILKRDRNKNILRFVTTAPCTNCNGTRLCKEARAVRWMGMNMPELTAMTIGELDAFVKDSTSKQAGQTPVAAALLKQIHERTTLLMELGLDYLTLDRESTSLSGGEAQRIRLANHVCEGLQGVLYVLDEPSVGLHPADQKRLMAVLTRLRANGNTVLVVEHDEATMLSADWLVDLGPAAGNEGGKLLFSGPPNNLAANTKSPTASHLFGAERIAPKKEQRNGTGELRIEGAQKHNLKDITAVFKTSAFNVVTGVSGAGKSTLVIETLARAVRAKLTGNNLHPGVHRSLTGADNFDKIVEIDQAPIGKTPRSNPATYTKLFDDIRAIFAAEDRAVEMGFGKGRFSFNVKGGRCEFCEGSGVHRVGMHFLDDVEVQCEQCAGKRFNESTLSVLYRGKNIHQILSMSVTEARNFFGDRPVAKRILDTLDRVGLGYISLGQPSTTLSGGEAQRIKLATELASPSKGRTLYVLNEPTTGLHAADVDVLVIALDHLVERGNTVVALEHDPRFILAADWVIDLGPRSGEAGGEVVVMGTPNDVANCKQSLTGQALANALSPRRAPNVKTPPTKPLDAIELTGVSTNNLRKINLKIPHKKFNVITGVSGSGKSSLAFDTIHAEGRRRFSESLSVQARRYYKQLPKPPVVNIKGISPTVAVSRDRGTSNPRSTVATFAEIHDLLRLIYARAGVSTDHKGPPPTSDLFSFNHHKGACKECRGLGTKIACNLEQLVTDPLKSLLNGAMDGTKTGKFYGERGGRHCAILQAVGAVNGVDFTKPWSLLTPNEQRLAMFGAGEQLFNVKWHFNRKGRKGSHEFKAKWLGFAGYVDEEYARVHGDHRGDKMANVMREDKCPACKGAGLAPLPLTFKFAGLSIDQVLLKTAANCLDFLTSIERNPAAFHLDNEASAITKEARSLAIGKLKPMVEAGLGYLTLDRRTSTLSGGEMSRLKLAVQLVSGLCSVTYVLDEPTVGLHHRDTKRLIDMLRRLKDAGNTVIVVEHDEEIIRAADHIIDVGPGAGDLGGEIIAEGTAEKISKIKKSLTGAYLTGHLKVAVPSKNRPPTPGLIIEGAHANNLKSINIKVPRGCLTALTGVSGSGKSTLLFDVIVPSFELGHAVGCDKISGIKNFERLVKMDQTPIGKSPASTPATYVGIFDQIRTLFAASPQAVDMGLKKAAFSFNSKAGRCDTCGGMGQVKVEMGFLSDMWITCDECRGRRYAPHILKVKLNEFSIADVLDMTVDKAIAFLADLEQPSFALDALLDVGLGHLLLGRSATTLSGGESMRLKLAAALGVRPKNKQNTASSTLYVLDEPTTGLHFDDVAKLLALLHRLTDQGHTILVAEHNIDVIKSADMIVDLGPEAGMDGGTIVASGTPYKLSKSMQSWTGQALDNLKRN